MRIGRHELSNGRVIVEVDANNYEEKLHEAILDKGENKDPESVEREHSQSRH